MRRWQHRSVRENGRRPAVDVRALATSVIAVVAAGLAPQACVPGAPTGLEEDPPGQEPGPAEPNPTGTITSRLTIGGPEAPDTLWLALDAAAPEPVEAADSRTWSDVPVGSHSVELSGVPANCGVLEANPRQVTVVEGDETPADFTVACVVPVGDLRVTAETHGSDIDENGYEVDLGRGIGKEKIDPNGTITFTGLDPGEHSVELRKVDHDCDIEGDNPVRVDVIVGELTEIAFVVECND